MCFLALYSIKADNGWAQVIEITPVIAKLMFCIFSIFLFCVHVGQEGTGTLHKQYQTLERWHYEKEESIFHELFILVHISFFITYTTSLLSVFI